MARAAEHGAVFTPYFEMKTDAKAQPTTEPFRSAAPGKGSWSDSMPQQQPGELRLPGPRLPPKFSREMLWVQLLPGGAKKIKIDPRSDPVAASALNVRCEETRIAPQPPIVEIISTSAFPTARIHCTFASREISFSFDELGRGSKAMTVHFRPPKFMEDPPGAVFRKPREVDLFQHLEEVAIAFDAPALEICRESFPMRSSISPVRPATPGSPGFRAQVVQKWTAAIRSVRMASLRHPELNYARPRCSRTPSLS